MVVPEDPAREKRGPAGAGRAEKRRHLRKEINWPVAIITDYVTIEGVSTNISSEGIFVRCDEPLPADEAFRMSILPPKQKAIEVVGKLVWSEFYGMEKGSMAFGMGICLVELSEENQNVLEKLLALAGAEP